MRCVKTNAEDQEESLHVFDIKIFKYNGSCPYLNSSKKTLLLPGSVEKEQSAFMNLYFSAPQPVNVYPYEN
ncbi:MAG TPA: hypothetical protein DCF44_07540 [Chitinophagaceae bacterium]|nr:hypothetical protein [Chitinophagaceae bacterium]